MMGPNFGYFLSNFGQNLDNEIFIYLLILRNLMFILSFFIFSSFKFYVTLKLWFFSVLTVEYNTGEAEKCTALQFLNAEQTTDKLGPYLFSQCQEINCRSLLPCMDTPLVKQSYEAKVGLKNLKNFGCSLFCSLFDI